MAIETSTYALELMSFLRTIIAAGWSPHRLLNLTEQDRLFWKYANDDQLTYTPAFQKLVTEQFEGYIRVLADIDPKGISDVHA